MTKVRLRKRLGLLAVIAMVASVGLGTTYWTHFFLLDRRSIEAADAIVAALQRDGEKVPMAILLAGEYAPDATVCLIPPYYGSDAVPELATANLGLDSMWLELVADRWIGVVVIDNHSDLLRVLRLPRSKVDILAYSVGARCHKLSGQPQFVRLRVSLDGTLEVTTLSEGVAP